MSDKKGKKREKILAILKNLLELTGVQEIRAAVESLSAQQRIEIQKILQGYQHDSLASITLNTILPFFSLNPIEDQVFKIIQKIVSDPTYSESFSKGFANHPRDPKKPEKGTLVDQIRQLDFPEVYNLIRRIHRELNQEKSFDEEPNPNAIQAIKGLMQSLTKTERGTIIGISTDDEVNRFITDCCQNIIITHLNQCILLDSMDDQTYYSLFVGNALDRLQEHYLGSWSADKAPQPS